MYKKSLFFNGKAVYDYVYNNTKVKNIVFGYYFLFPSEKFYGQFNDAEINVYYSDITLNCFNPKITIKKDEKDNTVINVHYNSFHYFLIVLMLLIATIVSIAGLNFCPHACNYLQMCGHFFVEASKADKILNFFQKSCHKRSVSNVD